jgi:GT2 family glycosyltransferase
MVADPLRLSEMRTDALSPQTKHDLSVVIVNWNTRALLAECLASLDAHVPAELDTQVIVVDNASSDGSAALVRDEWPAIELIVNESNVGYQRANNQALCRCSGEQILLINADAVLTAGCLDAMRARLAADTRAGIVGPRLVYADGTWQRWTAGHRLDATAAAVSFLFADRVAPRRGIWLARDTGEAFQPGWVSSACMLVRRGVLDQIGLMDERFFAYMDDVDLCERAIDAGWHVWYEPAATAVHVMGASSTQQTGTTSPLALRNLYRYIEVHRGRRAGAAARMAGTLGSIARAGVHSALGVRSGPHRAAAGAHWRNARLAFEPEEAP